MGVLAELAENLRLLGLDGDAEAVTLAGVLLGYLERDLDALDQRDFDTASAILRAAIGEAKDWPRIDPRTMWPAVAAWHDPADIAVAA